MKVNKVLKKRTNLTVISSFFILFAVIMSLIFIANSDIVKNDVRVDNDDLQLIYKNNNSDVQNRIIPLNLEDGKKQIPEDTVEIVNKSKFSTVFSVCVQQVDVSSKSLTTDKLYYSIKEESGILGNTNGCIYTGKIKANEKITLGIKVWPGSDLINPDDLGKELNLKFYVKQK